MNFDLAADSFSQYLNDKTVKIGEIFGDESPGAAHLLRTVSADCTLNTF